ncbi:MAG: cellulase family glycosylhydrolase [Actinomycetales bacterium]|nr:cellulase family glycosylhydrolase [Actinomycetales bacterium]
MSTVEGRNPLSGRRSGRARLAAAAVMATVAAVLPVSGSQTASAAVPENDWLHVQGNQIVDQAGNPVWLTGANWFGFNASERVFHGLWSGNVTEITKAMADRGINLVRVPISTQLLLEWKAGTFGTVNVNTYANPELTGKNSLQVFDYWLELCEKYGIKVLLDLHSAEADNSGHIAPMWYKGTITPEMFYQGWEWVTARYKNNDTIVAMDLKNEPHGQPDTSPRAKWDGSTDVDNWKYTAETAAKRILAINPNVLVLVEGIEAYPRPGQTWDSPSTNPDRSSNFYNNWWGGNLRGVRDYPVNLGANQDQLVYSPHDYGPLVYEQPWFTGTFDKDSLTTDVWQPNWLYIHEEKIAPLLIGEWGGRLGQDARQDKWMTALRDLITENGLHQTFWCLNPNSGDTGGLLLDDWKTWDETKYKMLRPALWQHGGKFVSLDHQVPLGGSGSTTGISLADRYGGGGPTSTTTTTSPRTTTTTTSPRTTTTTTTTTSGGEGACTASYSVASSWPTGFVANVTVTAGSSAIRGWRVTMNLGDASVSNLWNGTLSGTSGEVTVSNAAYNGSLGAAQNTSFGFQGTGNGSGVSVTCSPA